MDYIRGNGIGQKEQTGRKLMTLRFLAVQLFATIAITLPRDDAPWGRRHRKQT